MAHVRPRITQPQAYGLFRPIPRIVALPPIHTPHFRRLTVLVSVRSHPLDHDSSPGDIHQRQQRSRWVVDRRPIYNPTRVGWVHGALSQVASHHHVRNKASLFDVGHMVQTKYANNPVPSLSKRFPYH